MKRSGLLSAILIIAAVGIADKAAPACLQVPLDDPKLKIDPTAMVAFSQAKLGRGDFYRVMQVVAKYETDGCWGQPTGNFDKQWLSVGVMQWNLGTGSLQPLLKDFREKFPDRASFDQELTQLMPRYGQKLFDTTCRSIPIGQRCKEFLLSQYAGEDYHLASDFEGEVNALFESDVMRQIQVDYFARNLTRVLDDLNRVFQQRAPRAWQVAWAMDLKTQQNKFPTDSSIKMERNAIATSTLQQRQDRLLAIIDWYDALCRTGEVGGVRLDYNYNVDAWTQDVKHALVRDQEEVVHFIFS